MHEVEALHFRAGRRGERDRAGIVDTNIDAAEGLRCLCRSLQNLLFAANVADQRQGFAARFLYLCSFLSGAAALFYELAWSKLLSLMKSWAPYP